MKKEVIANYAYENVPFYMDMNNNPRKKWEDLPIINKNIILKKINSVFAPQYMSDLFAGSLDHVLTSGSTGECLDIFWKKEQNMKSLIPLWNKRKRYYNILPSDRRCYFFTTKIVDGKDIEFEESQHGLGFSKMNLSEEKIINIYNRMLEFSPRWMIVQPSLAYLIIKIAKKEKLPPLPELTYVEFTGERIMESIKSITQDFFGCNVASQYGCYEVNSIAYECPCGSLHVMSENVYVEEIEQNDLCITSLQNKVMPFIRYKIGDKGRVIQIHNCPCGNAEPIIELEKSRENDWIYHTDGTVSHSDVFCHIIEKINLYQQQAIQQYQIVQVDYDEFDIYIVLDDEEEASLVQIMFKEMYEKYQQGSVLKFHFVDYLYPSEKTGKLAWFTSKMRGENVL